MDINAQEVEQDVGTRIRQAITEGDLTRVKALAELFPRVFDRWHDEFVDLAQDCHRGSVLIYLIVEKGFEVSPSFAGREFGGDLLADGVNEYHKTLEVLANAVLGFGYDTSKSLACYALRNMARENKPVALDPEFVTLVTHGKFAEYVARRMHDERYGQCVNRHTGRMLRQLADDEMKLRDYCSQHQPPQENTADTPRVR